MAHFFLWRCPVSTHHSLVWHVIPIYRSRDPPKVHKQLTHLPLYRKGESIYLKFSFFSPHNLQRSSTASDKAASIYGTLQVFPTFFLLTITSHWSAISRRPCCCCCQKERQIGNQNSSLPQVVTTNWRRNEVNRHLSVSLRPMFLSLVPPLTTLEGVLYQHQVRLSTVARVVGVLYMMVIHIIAVMVETVRAAILLFLWDGATVKKQEFSPNVLADWADTWALLPLQNWLFFPLERTGRNL